MHEAVEPDSNKLGLAGCAPSDLPLDGPHCARESQAWVLKSPVKAERLLGHGQRAAARVTGSLSEGGLQNEITGSSSWIPGASCTISKSLMPGRNNSMIRPRPTHHVSPLPGGHCQAAQASRARSRPGALQRSLLLAHRRHTARSSSTAHAPPPSSRPAPNCPLGPSTIGHWPLTIGALRLRSAASSCPLCSPARQQLRPSSTT